MSLDRLLWAQQKGSLALWVCVCFVSFFLRFSALQATSQDRQEKVPAKTSRRGGNRTWQRAAFCMLPAAEVVVFARDCEPPEWLIKHVILAVFRNSRWQARGKWSVLSLCTCGKRGQFLVNWHERTAKRTADLRFSLVARVRLLEHVFNNPLQNDRDANANNANVTPT